MLIFAVGGTLAVCRPGNVAIFSRCRQFETKRETIMRRRTRALVIVFAVTAIIGSICRAGEPDAAALAAQIDRYIETRLKAEGVRPAGEADDAEFIRRVCLDLHGAVPSAEQTARFLADAGPTKREKLVDALLASPRYGEHLADIWQAYLVSPLA